MLLDLCLKKQVCLGKGYRCVKYQEPALTSSGPAARTVPGRASIGKTCKSVHCGGKSQRDLSLILLRLIFRCKNATESHIFYGSYEEVSLCPWKRQSGHHWTIEHHVKEPYWEQRLCAAFNGPLSRYSIRMKPALDTSGPAGPLASETSKSGVVSTHCEI